MSEELRWKDKYLESLEQQERIEARWNAQLDLLRRGLVRSSLAAEGVDKAIDRCMQDLRAIMRKEDMGSALEELIPRLEKTVLDGEGQREERTRQVLAALERLVSQLQSLELPDVLRKRLRGFERQLAKRVEQAYNWPALIAELSELQNLALEQGRSGEAPRAGLMQRLFGTQTREPLPPLRYATPDDLIDAGEFASEEDAAPATSATATPSGFPRATTLDSLPAPTELTQPLPPLPAAEEGYSLVVSGEPGYSAIANHVQSTLLGLLDELKAPQTHSAQVDNLRERITAGLNMYELVPVLDDLSALVLSVAGLGINEFEGYLKQLNERLAAFQDSLKGANEGYVDSISAARELDSELRLQVDGLHSCVQGAGSLVELKDVVESRLQGLLGTMDQHQRQRDLREQEAAERLRVLVDRVAKMELEARSFQDHLEVQRQKALIDSLTELPNRAALHERLAIEVARWQRYGGDVLLAVVDVDFFKRINDGYGHLAGDKVLKMIAAELSKRLRQTDFIARFGGEEFVLLLPGTPLEGGLQLVEALRQGIQECPFHFKGERVTITLSAGVAAFADSTDTAETVFERADQALYRAKANGRNRIETG